MTEKRIHRLHYITHPDPLRDAEEQVQLLASGLPPDTCLWVQFRLKKAGPDEFRKQARRVGELTRAAGGTFIINDDVMAAKHLDADGVHLGKEDLSPLMAREILGPDKIIGCTANRYEDLEYLSALPIDYIGLGPLRFTKTKEKLSPLLGFEGYQDILTRRRSDRLKELPVIAIGGVLQEDLSRLFGMGLHGVAVSGAIARAENPALEHRCWNEKLAALSQPFKNKQIE